mmetsp:Transcript_8133/g.22488  ORF Transcript_8133/g.22488 Transcript_8133/m.22488 type:complete len:261 (+) Transcript_8133:947-1729(+)
MSAFSACDTAASAAARATTRSAEKAEPAFTSELSDSELGECEQDAPLACLAFRSTFRTCRFRSFSGSLVFRGCFPKHCFLLCNLCTPPPRSFLVRRGLPRLRDWRLQLLSALPARLKRLAGLWLPLWLHFLTLAAGLALLSPSASFSRRRKSSKNPASWRLGSKMPRPSFSQKSRQRLLYDAEARCPALTCVTSASRLGSSKKRSDFAGDADVSRRGSLSSWPSPGKARESDLPLSDFDWPPAASLGVSLAGESRERCGD